MNSLLGPAWMISCFAWLVMTSTGGFAWAEDTETNTDAETTPSDVEAQTEAETPTDPEPTEDDPKLRGYTEEERKQLLRAREEDKTLESPQGDVFTPVDRDKVPLEPMPDWMVQDEIKRDWTFSLAPGYSLLYLSEDEETRHGGGLRGLVAYNFTDNWSLDFRLSLALAEGDRGEDSGLYSMTNIISAGRYTFFSYDTVLRPFVYFGVGWGYASYDLEAMRIVRSHHLVLEPGGGFSARVYKHWHLGLEAGFTPFFLGDSETANSFVFFPRFVIEYQL